MQAQTMLIGNLPLREKISHIFLSFCHINLQFTLFLNIHVVKMNRRKTGLGQILCGGLLVKLEHIFFITVFS